MSNSEFVLVFPFKDLPLRKDAPNNLQRSLHFTTYNEQFKIVVTISEIKLSEIQVFTVAQIGNLWPLRAIFGKWI